MLNEQTVRDALSRVIDPELGKNLVELNMIRDLSVSPQGAVSFTLALTVASCPLREQLKANARQAVEALEGVRSVDVALGAMTDEERRAVMGSAAPVLPQLNHMSRIERVVAVLSGKGGVGKSSVTALLACALARQEKKVGILDADITGPSIPRLFGLPSGGLRGGPQGILPAATRSGIRVISTNLLLAEETQAVIWRGPLITGTIHQFWKDVLWGRLDVLLVDLPPGTGDATLTVMQALPVSAAVMVTTPQALAGMVVQKAYGLLEKLSIPVIGVVENMSYYRCPDTGKAHEIFGPSHAEETARACAAPLSARLAVDPQMAVLADNGQVEQIPIPEDLALLAGQLVSLPAEKTRR